MLEKIRIVIEENDNKWGRIFDIFIQVLILISLICFSIDTLPSLSKNQKDILDLFELIIVAIFSAEYILRIIVSKKKLRFIFSFYGLTDLLAILPFYLFTGIDLRAIRAFRLLRLLRAFKLVRFTKAMDHIKKAFNMVKEEFTMFFFVTFILIFLSAAGIYFFENQAQPEVYSSIFTSLWWSVVTLTTVGYGDMYPITAGGRIFTVIVMFIGIGVIAVPTGLLASALGKVRDSESK